MHAFSKVNNVIMSVGSEDGRTSEVQELQAFRHGSEDLVLQQQASEGPTGSRIRLHALTPLPLNFRLSETDLSRFPAQ